MTRYPQFEVTGRIEPEETVITDETRSVIVGPTPTGPAFIPQAVGSEERLDDIFGSETQTTWAARQQIREGGVPRVQRILETFPWNPQALFLGLNDPGQALNGELYEYPSSLSLDSVVAAILAIDRPGVSFALTPGSYEDFNIELYNDSGVIVDSLDGVSMDPGSPRYFAEILPDQLDGVNVHANFVDTQVLLRGEQLRSRFEDSGFINFTDVGPDRATTPWVTSQADVLGGGGRQRLFRFHMLSEGPNREVKISIANIREDTFDVLVRDFTDSDLNPEVLEEYEGLNLDRSSENFIGRAIGDDVQFFEDGELINSGGQFDVRSDYVRVEVAQGFIPEDARPFGFEGYKEPAKRPVGVAIPEMPFVENRQGLQQEILGNRRRSVYLGTEISNLQSLGFFNPIPEGTRVQDGYFLDDVLGPDLEDSDVAERRFTLGFQGGYEGSDPYKERKYGDNVTPQNAQGLDLSSFDASGTEAYETAYSIIDDPGTFGLAHLSTPGVIAQDHYPAIQVSQQLCEGRKDCLYTFQTAHLGSTLSEIETAAQRATGSFTAAYHSWFESDLDWFIPLGDLIPAIYAQTDNQATPARAPAGRELGRIPTVAPEEVFGEEFGEQLLEARVNHASRKRGFLVVIGNQTRRGQGARSQINVRRGLNFVKFEAQRAARELLFEPNTEENRSQLQTDIRSAVEPLSQRGGINEFDVTVSGQRNTINGSVQLSFQNVIDRVEINFIVRREEVVFV